MADFSWSKEQTWSLLTLADLQALAADIATHCRAGQVIGLRGPLGAGKTTWVQAMTKALGIKESVLSPSFSYLHLYGSGRLPVAHADLYRADPVEKITPELEDIIRSGQSLLLIEWPDCWQDGLDYLDGIFSFEVGVDDTRNLIFLPGAC